MANEVARGLQVGQKRESGRWGGMTRAREVEIGPQPG